MGRKQLGSLGLALAGLVAAAAFVLVPTAGATFPGGNGLIAFDAYNDSTGYDIYTMKADGSSRTQITSSTDYDKAPAWSPDGTKIAFVRALASGTSLGPNQLWVMNADGSGQTRLTNGSWSDSDPAWSPDGTKIVFASTRDDPAPRGCGPCNYELYRMNADGSGVTRLTNSPTIDFQPDWSPDGTKIAFVSNRTGNNDIYLMNADGSGTPTDLTNNAADNQNPAWTPDGSKIVYSSKPAGGGFDLYSIPATGGTPTQLTINTPGYEFNPAPSPDGTKIAFDTDRSVPSQRRPASSTGHSIGICPDVVPLMGCKDLGDGQDPSIQSLASPCPDGLKISVDVGGHRLTVGNPEINTDLYEADAATPGPYTWSATGLPPGMAVVDSSGNRRVVTVAGTPIQAGTYTYTLTVTDGNGCTASVTKTVVVAPSVHIEQGKFSTIVTYALILSQGPRVAAAAKVATYDVRERHAPYNAGFGSWTTLQSASTDTSFKFSGIPGNTYCFSAEPASAAGQGWGDETCTSLFLDDRSLTRSGHWTRGSGSGFFLRTYSSSRSKGAALTKAGVVAKELAVLVEKCPRCGSVEVMFSGAPLKSIDLAAASTKKEQTIELPAFPTVETGTVTIKVTSKGKPVVIDGLGVLNVP
jgi:hypothetical protein